MPAFPPLHDLPLPSFARLDLARQLTMALPTEIVTAESLRKIPGDAFCIPLAINAILNTGATPGNRTLGIIIRDGDGTAIVRMTASLLTPASGANVYAFLATVNSAWSVTNNAAAPIMPTIALPGWSIGLRGEGVFAGDFLSNPRLTCIDIPTGPELPATLVPQPLALT